ncbi:MAG: LON peptidase substrate-binding domain-containing protein [Bacteriovoracaceae bacterium]
MQYVKVNLFPLSDVVLYPHASLPLNIFEPRYIKMIHDSINSHTPIALMLTNFLENEQFILKTNAGDFTETIVGIGHPQIIHENVDGSMFIMLRGVGKAKLVEKTDDKQYRTYNALMIEEDEEISNDSRFRINRLKNMLKLWLETNIKSKEDRETFFKKIVKPNEIVAYAAHFLVENPSHKMAILEANNISTKLEMVLEYAKHEEIPFEGKILAIS